MKQQKTNITLYTIIKDDTKMVDTIKKHFKDISNHIEKAENVMMVTLFDDSEVSFHINSDPTYVKPQVAGM